MYCSYNKYCICIIFYSDVGENKVSRALGEVEHQESLFVMFSTKKSEFQCLCLFIAYGVCTVPVTGTVFDTYLDVG